MIILLTGKPGIGKSTAIEAFIARNRLPATWVVTKEMIDPASGLRCGFRAVNSAGEERVVSHKTAIKSDAIIGQNHVDVEAVDALFTDVLEHAVTSKKRLIIVDEIGPIQLLSQGFRDKLEQAFQTRANVVASIHYSDERLARYREDPENILLEVTEANRDMLPATLAAVTEYAPDIARLSQQQQKSVRELIVRYVQRAKLVQLQKLMSHAIQYITGGDIACGSADNHWRVKGRHGVYDVVRDKSGAFHCDCDLFNGRKRYRGQAGECSHVQAVVIFEKYA